MRTLTANNYMCLAFPGKIISISKNLAMVNFNGVKKEINISLTPGVKKRDYIIAHTGFAIQKMGKQEAMDMKHITRNIKHATRK